MKDCPRARSFTAPQTGGNISSVHKGSKSVALLSVPRQGTQTAGRQDARAPARAYAMKAVEDTDAPDVIIGNFTIFDTFVHALIDLGQPIHMCVLTYPTWVMYRGVKPSMISW